MSLTSLIDHAAAVQREMREARRAAFRSEGVPFIAKKPRAGWLDLEDEIAEELEGLSSRHHAIEDAYEVARSRRLARQRLMRRPPVLRRLTFVTAPRIQRWRDKGICVDCDARAVPGRLRCDVHLLAQRTLQRAFFERYRGDGPGDGRAALLGLGARVAANDVLVFVDRTPWGHLLVGRVLGAKGGCPFYVECTPAGLTLSATRPGAHRKVHDALPILDVEALAAWIDNARRRLTETMKVRSARRPWRPRRVAMLAALLAGASARATARTVHVNKDTAALWKKKLASGDVPADLLAEARALLVALASEAER